MGSIGKKQSLCCPKHIRGCYGKNDTKRKGFGCNEPAATGYKRIITAAKEIKPDILVFFHSDGNCEEIIPDLIDVGIGILNPVQPECMDPAEIKLKYGHKLAFWGTIGTQTTMPFGTSEDVKQTVKERIETVGVGGGLLLSPTHLLQVEVPWDNIIAFFDAVDEYGVY